MAVATRNIRDFEDTGIDVIDPWEGARELSRPDCRQDPELEAELRAGPRRRGVQRFSSRLHAAPIGTAAGAAG